MPRIIGVDIPKEKRVEVALTYIYGIGPARARNILEQAGIPPEKRAKDLDDQEVTNITKIIQESFQVEGDLRRMETGNIKRLMAINSYRGLRHKRNLPVRGQRTRTNSRTRKGPKRTIGAFKDKATRSAVKPATPK
ncbi:MAG: 30S ribosomal protein S13 [Candidatus Omnitrophica bacterium]|nr:30S ribosomal protein S13 [Candidatus Omnitrophota bacterium]MDD5487374.1 30S ribosomal protein S13 [Candidatus Omnitrophota bacterium]